MTSKGASEAASEAQNDEGKDFEEAISATGFGLFNFLLLGISMIWFTASLAETTSPGLILSVAQCDLELDLDRKGWITSITFFGMIFGANLWGIVGDIYGRRLIISVALILMGVFNVLYGFSTSYYMLVTLKFFGGFVASGPVAAYIAYISEFHGVKYRARVVIFQSGFISVGGMVATILGLLILPLPISFSIGSTEYHSWRVFFWSCSLLGLTGGFLSLFLPESPKFLMALGKKDEALKVFQLVYRLNTGKSSDSYPIKSLKDDVVDARVNSAESGGKNAKSTIIRKTFSQFLPLFKPPHLWKCLLAGAIEFFVLLGVNTMRSWMPQVFALLSNTHSDEGLCESIQPKSALTTFNNATDDLACEVLSDKSIYVNSIIVQAVGMIAVILVVLLVTIVGNKTILFVTTLVAAASSLAIYFAQNSMTIVIMYSLAVGIGLSGQASFNSIVSNLVPTAFRFTVISVSVTLGRLGSMLGNLIFPNLLKLGCWQPFAAMSLAYAISAALCLLLPKTTKQPLQ
ncbi:synaptic vesicle glycoprotein 2C-like [Phlebotomus argentipes]|uniref:synaptic vesicle glycoprotein 2C-like n=1 Tax=Phlebotomus argentipes TaxID=94469 RepID=UPI002892AE2D|nr:synaptic vesicle glycoprotein 2C-like [Phlebotomus argentipes]